MRDLLLLPDGINPSRNSEKAVDYRKIFNECSCLTIFRLFLVIAFLCL